MTANISDRRHTGRHSNPFAALYAGGYTKATTRQLQFDAGIKNDMSKITEGLPFHRRGAVDYNTYYATSIDPKYAVYQAYWTSYNGKDVIDHLVKYGDDPQFRHTECQRIVRTRQTLLCSPGSV